MSDVKYRTKLEQKEQAAAELEKWQSSLGNQHPRVIEARLALTEASESLEDYSRQHGGDHGAATGDGRKSQRSVPAPLEQEPKSSPQTVLVVSVQRDFGRYDNSIGRSVVMFLDGLPTPGQYWMSSENSVLITYSAWSAPARSRVALNGSVKIVKVT